MEPSSATIHLVLFDEDAADPDYEPEFTRLSHCCHAAVVHISPITARSLRVALEMICSCCKGRVVAFDVVNEVGETVWRVE